MNTSIPVSTWIWLGVIAAVFIILFILVLRFRRNDSLSANRRLVDYFPTLVSTLGVLGTFYGITVGLIAFDSSDLDKSIPGLLDGLKTAFFTSLAGMLGSMILSAFISKKQDEKEGGISDINQAAVTISQAVQQMSDLNRQTLENLSNQITQQTQTQATFYQTINQVLNNIHTSQTTIAGHLSNIKDTQTSYSGTIETIATLVFSQDSTLTSIHESTAGLNSVSELLTTIKDSTEGLNTVPDLVKNIDTTLSTLKESTANIVASIGNIEDNSGKQTTTLTSIQENSGKVVENTSYTSEILDTVSGINGTQDKINEQVQKLKDILDGEVDQIEKSMKQTNDLLEKKFNEFTELLKKSNTEALVEVMKNVTAEFQKQMNALINKLIQENFDQLNKSVEKLNQWQQENKEMIVSLTSQYKEMAHNFEGTSTSLDRVKTDTESLVSEGGKLRQIVDALNRVIVQDERFLQTAENLHKTAELSKTNMESFDESTKALNAWVKKQKNFVEGVTLLITKLEEIEKIKDYNETFWKGTKDSLNDGVGILNETADKLRTSLTDIDRQFYQRLNATLGNLDSCIQAMITGRNN